MPNRTQAPPLKEILNIPLHQFQQHELDNGLPVYQINKGTQDIIKLELVFLAGRWFESQKLTSRTTARQLREGTKTLTSQSIAEQIDYYGGSLRTSANLDTSSITLYCMRKHLPNILPTLESVLVEPIFPEAELDIFKRLQSQRLKVDMSKNDILAYREITQHFFGQEHPYGYNSNPQLYENIALADLKQFHQDFYHAGNCKIFLSGKTDQSTIQLLNQHLGRSMVRKPVVERQHLINAQSQKKHFTERPGSVQSAIRIGRRMISKSHPDFPGFYILNCILGGYFGSRLMNNIREEKGYTYGIYSAIDTMLNDAYFYISTEVACEVTEATLQEIYKEIRLLRDTLIPQSEIDRVRNYLTGMLLTSLDGPFNMADVLKTLVLEDLDKAYIDNLLATLRTIQPQTLQDLAQKYLREEDLYEVVVGLQS
ncbi:MAG: pitrilysin family protein [Bacteroidota bacterium]